MDAATRTQKIQEIIDRRNTDGSKRIIYKNETETMDAYAIPVEYLIFNQYNGRIGTFVKTYEKFNEPIDATTTEGEEKIVNFLWESNISRNEETKKDIEEKGQLEVGIVTKDGVIIDGNRRCMLRKKIAKEKKDSPTYFRAVVLPDKLHDNVKEIKKLETVYQMGADQPVDYNPIEKYLRCKELKKDFDEEEIANFMGETTNTIKRYLGILGLMEDYLKKTGYKEIYAVLNKQKVEGPFVDLFSYLNTHENGSGIHGRDWTPEEEDIDELKNIYFDYIRAGFGTHPPRDIGNPAKGKGFFSHKTLWKEFAEKHFSKMESINDNEKTFDVFRQERPEENIDSLITARDSDWKKQTENSLKENLYKTKRELEDIGEANKPIELLQRAKNTLEKINTEHSEFNENVLDSVKGLNSLLWDFQQVIKKKNK